MSRCADRIWTRSGDPVGACPDAVASRWPMRRGPDDAVRVIPEAGRRRLCAGESALDEWTD